MILLQKKRTQENCQAFFIKNEAMVLIRQKNLGLAAI